MSKSTHMTLAQFGTLAIAEAVDLPIDQIVLLQEDIARDEGLIAAAKAKLQAVLVSRYGATAQRLRKSARKVTGTVILADGDFTVRAELPRTVLWDQPKLAKLAETIFHDWQLDPEDYIQISYAVEERTYAAWPPHLRKQFDGARLLGIGDPRFTIILTKSGAAQ